MGVEAAPTAARKAALGAEVVIVIVAYVAVSRAAIASFDAAPILPAFLSPREAAVGGVFLVGALAQLLFVLALATIPAMDDLRRAIRNTWQPATSKAWHIALAAAAFQCAVVILFFIPDPFAVVELSPRNALLSLLPATDGWTQEVVFRGYVILRLARAGFPVAVQIAASALAFAAIHLGYIGSDGLGIWWPLLGTATLGAVLALSVIAGRGSIRPAVTAHALIIVVVQPWLALAV